MINNFLIIGDSYSTFKGYNPEGYAYWYGNEGHINETDVKSAEECWWHLLEKEDWAECVGRCSSCPCGNVSTMYERIVGAVHR